MRRIAIVGNVAGGKTTLARALSKPTGLPVYHVDSFRFRPDGRRKPMREVDASLAEVEANPKWIIEGLSGQASVERRMRAADTVVFIDFPLPVHYWYAIRRQWLGHNSTHAERSDKAKTRPIRYLWKLTRGIWRVHSLYRSLLLDVTRSLPESTQVHHLRRPSERDAFISSIAASRARPRSES